MTVSGSGTVSLGYGGWLTTNDLTLSMSGGTFSTWYHYIGSSGTGSFTQTGGRYQVKSDLLLGNNATDIGTYTLSGSAYMSIWGNGGSTYFTVGNSGTGTFVQTGGTIDVDSSTEGLFLADNSGSSGAYILNGGLLLINWIRPGYGNATFDFGGGTLCGDGTTSSGGFVSWANMTLTGSGGNANFDTNGHPATILGQLSGPGGLNKLGLHLDSEHVEYLFGKYTGQRRLAGLGQRAGHAE